MKFGWIKTNLFFLSAALSLGSSPLLGELSQAENAFPKEGYTINYNTLSIIEYIRFASKICEVNFIFDERELDFNVTVVSEGPITSQNVMATLIQLLRIHGLTLLEQDNNLVIHKSSEVKQIGKLVFDGNDNGTSPIVTRLFHLKSLKPETMAAIIRPLISRDSILEVSSETQRLILTDITANVDKVATLIAHLDIPVAKIETHIYEAKYNSPDTLIQMATQIMQPIAQGQPFIMVPQPLVNKIYIVSTPDLTQTVLHLLEDLDSPPNKHVLLKNNLRAENIYIYKVEHASNERVLQALKGIAAHLKQTGIGETDLIESINEAKLIREANSILFVAPKDSVEKIQEFLRALDVATAGSSGPSSFFIFKPQYLTPQEVQNAITEMAHNLKLSKGADKALIDTIETGKINPLTNTISFSGEERTFGQVKELLSTVDTPSADSLQSSHKNQFFLYPLQHAPADRVTAALQHFAKDLKSSNISEHELIEAVHNMKYIKESNAFLFTGSDTALKRIRELMKTFDVPFSASVPESDKTFFLFTPEHATKTQIEEYLHGLAANLNTHVDADLHAMIESRKWLDPSQSFIFQGSLSSAPKLQELLKTFDNPTRLLPSGPQHNYFIYKLQNTTGNIIEEELDSIAKNMKLSGMADSKLVHVIEHMRYIKETNSILLTGDPLAIEEVKQLIAKNDYEPPAFGTSKKNHFYLYKPRNMPADYIEKSLHDIRANLQKAGLADPDLLAAMESMKYVQSTNSIIFTGTTDALNKIQVLIQEIDVSSPIHAPIQHVGETTFLLYKLKNAGGPQIVSSIRSISSDLRKSGTSDREFLKTLDSMKYVSETNSLMFTGTQEALQKTQALVEKFDVPSLQPRAGPETVHGPENFFIYQTQALTGEELERLLQNFAENLTSSGLYDPELFNTIRSVRWVEKTQSLIFTGSEKSLKKVKELLQSLDIPSNLPAGSQGLSDNDSSIQAIENTGFLVYKLQFHKGDEIQGALRQIAKEMSAQNLTGTPVNQQLLNSINSIQWLEVTNSLLSSGDQETLVRLRELIKSLDVPLKQVFIEMLVIATSLSNTLTFGLEWGGKYKYLDKFSGSIQNNAPTNAVDNFMQNVQTVSPTNTPVPTMIPFAGNGFDLGIIGEVIRHKGQTFLTLGSLLNALQQDIETAVIMNPKIVAQDSKTSSIFVGQNIPFAGSFINNQGSNTVNTANIEYRDIGMNLTITPVLGNSDIVTLDISFDQSSTSSSSSPALVSSGTVTLSGVTTNKNSMQTTVHVPDNNFLILTGMVTANQNKSTTGLPCLGGLPWIGAAFSTDVDVNSNSNIVLFIRPHILNSLEDMKKISKAQEDFFREQAGSPFLEHNFNEGMEIIKTVDDE